MSAHFPLGAGVSLAIELAGMSLPGTGRVKTLVLAVNTRILEKCILQLDAVSPSSATVSDSLRKHFRFGCSAHEFSHGLDPNRTDLELPPLRNVSRGRRRPCWPQLLASLNRKVRNCFTASTLALCAASLYPM